MGSSSCAALNVEALEYAQDRAAIEEMSDLAEALVNNQQIAVVENWTAVENDPDIVWRPNSAPLPL